MRQDKIVRAARAEQRQIEMDFSHPILRNGMSSLLCRPIADSARLAAKLAKNATLRVYKGYPHGMATTHADVINADLLAFIQS